MKDGLVRAALFCLLAVPASAQDPTDLEKDVTQGALRITRAGRLVECPLRHTDVQADVSGFVARVKVTQRFVNPSDEPIEALYVFPLPHRAAVDDMSMVVGKRRIVGLVRRRAEARDIYEAALAQGLTAGLLEQERPNIFTQSVGNIPPGEEVLIEISYVDVLEYDQGTYEFHFPMVVGPRYIPAGVPDAARITPPVLKPGYRTGHDISLALRLEAGVPVRDLRVTSHQSQVQRTGRSQAQVKLSAAEAIPNKDFVLRYAVAGSKPELALLTHAPRGDDGYFLLMVQPRQMDEELREAPPREICFLVDVSGSMSGEPTAKVVETMRLLLKRMRPQDRIQVVTFASQAQKLFPAYLPATPPNIGRALAFTGALQGSGGTEMLQGIRTVLADPIEDGHVRIVLLLTDGYIGNEDEIIREVGRRAGDQIRFWAVGVGSSPNRHLIDGVGRQGGMSANLGLREDPAPLVASVADRMQRAQLGRIELDWGQHAVYETYPARVPDLWSGTPVVVVGRYRTHGPGTVRVNGRAEGQAVSFPLEVHFPDAAGDHAVLAKVWARRKIEDLTEQMTVAGDPLEEEITELALQYRLASAFTSFVAVDESEQARRLASPRPPRRVMVPVPMPDGVSYEGVFGYGGVDMRPEAEAQKITSAADHALVARFARVEGTRGAYRALRSAAPTPGASGGRHALAFQEARLRKAAPQAPLAPPPPPATLYAAPAGGPVEPSDPGTEIWRHQEAKKAVAQVSALVAAKNWTAARRALQRAWLHEQEHFAANPWADDGTRAAVAAEWQSLEAAHAAAMTAAQPALARILDLVVRNQDLESALDSVARAAGITVRIVPGSLAQAAQRQRREALRIGYLDLRRATAAQALGWLLGPFGLEWDLAGGAVVVSAPDLEELRARGIPTPGDLRNEGLARASAALQAHSWALLATALAGQVDDEAVAELREAWGAPGLAEALGRPDAPLTVEARTVWVIAQARRAAPADEALGALAQEAYAVLGDALARRRKRPDPIAAADAEVYLALLASEDGVPAALRAGAPSADQVLRSADEGFRTVAASLLTSAKPDAIAAAFEAGALRGDDPVVLAAWALRKADASAWNRFRASKSSWLISSGATGGALRVVNRLEASRFLRASPPLRAREAAETPRPRLGLAAAGAGVGLAVAGMVLRRRLLAGR
jgi:Ca-activated chloride channel homolog